NRPCREYCVRSASAWGGCPSSPGFSAPRRSSVTKMDARSHAILLESDSATDIESPPGFDWQQSMAAGNVLKPHAERILGQSLRLDDQVQDASFFAELFVFEDGAVGPNGVTTTVFKIAIRFSTFGKMATIHTNSPAPALDKYPVTRLVELLEQR